MVFFLATLHLAVTFLQALFNKNGKILLGTTYTRKGKILKAPGCRFHGDSSPSKSCCGPLNMSVITTIVSISCDCIVMFQ